MPRRGIGAESDRSGTRLGVEKRPNHAGRIVGQHIDILITHGPPKGILDVTADMDAGEPVHVGFRSLRRHVRERIKPKLHAFGHIHDEKHFNNYGTIIRDGTQFINCSCCDLAGRFKNNGLVVTVESATASP